MLYSDEDEFNWTSGWIYDRHDRYGISVWNIPWQYPIQEDDCYIRFRPATTYWPDMLLCARKDLGRTQVCTIAS